MSRVWGSARGYGIDLLIVLGATEAALEVALRDDVGRELTTSRWFAAPAAACVVLALLARRRWPLGAPAAMWSLAVALSFVEGWLVVSAEARVGEGGESS